MELPRPAAGRRAPGWAARRSPKTLESGGYSATAGNGLSTKPSRATALFAALFVFFASLGASVLVASLVGSSDGTAAGEGRVGMRLLVAVTVLEVTQAGLVLGFAASRKSFTQLRIRGPWLRGIAAGVPLGFAFQVATVLVFLSIQRVLPEFSPESAMGPIEREFGALSAAMRLAFVLAAGMMAPVAEELLFRGLLLYGLEAPDWRFGRVFAVGASALLFAAVHLNAWGFAVFAALGVVLGWVTLRKGSVSYAIGTHLGFNLTAFAALVLR